MWRATMAGQLGADKGYVLAEWLVVLAMMGVVGGIGLGTWWRLVSQLALDGQRAQLIVGMLESHARALAYRQPVKWERRGTDWVSSMGHRYPFDPAWGVTGTGYLGFTANGTSMYAGTIYAPDPLLSVGVGYTRVAIKGYLAMGGQ